MEDVVPARFVHIDQSTYGAYEVLRDNIHPPELAEKLGKTRWGIINVCIDMLLGEPWFADCQAGLATNNVCPALVVIPT